MSKFIEEYLLQVYTHSLCFWVDCFLRQKLFMSGTNFSVWFIWDKGNDSLRFIALGIGCDFMLNKCKYSPVHLQFTTLEPRYCDKYRVRRVETQPARRQPQKDWEGVGKQREIHWKDEHFSYLGSISASRNNEFPKSAINKLFHFLGQRRSCKACQSFQNGL